MTTDTPGGRGLLARLRRASNGAPRRRGRLARRLGSALRLTAALTLAGGLYIAIAPASQAQDVPLSATAQDGKAIYDQSCISCHGRNAQGVTDKGPSLIGVGAAAVEFQVTSGRMPAARQEAQMERKQPMWEGQELVDNSNALAQYIQELGGGPQVPAGNDFAAQGAASANGQGIAKGGELFRINCSSCHAFSAGGGALSSGKFAPSLAESTDRQIYAAMLSGPQNMPVFGDNQLTPEQKMQIIAYVQDLNADHNPGGWGLGRFGPVTEGLAIFLVGIVALVFATLWIAGKS
ncbi:ubiquinol-cytochrome c reductase cytochrome c subunit [Allocatelliglobosispora scoriae]|uniref:Cytochrome bc1 complex cytochrome c subunit n=1 Tax=Allocatelliglobosispora scoriae TaxID=643052 RepID=A0A841BQ21_9ACTN|nr:cytochrome c [Allocatelliglobosispora scoriae]MBB5869468.1 ubiquinol-cytochrome c reductase cytochrome c subunit [Allocatelliglobosispora scoriae]